MRGVVFEWKTKRVGLDDVDACEVAAIAQQLDERRIDFDSRNRRAALVERDRERTGTRADFENARTAIVECERCDALRYRFVKQKVLTEMPLRT